jgi:hypothetical protein
MDSAKGGRAQHAQFNNSAQSLSIQYPTSNNETNQTVKTLQLYVQSSRTSSLEQR